MPCDRLPFVVEIDNCKRECKRRYVLEVIEVSYASIETNDYLFFEGQWIVDGICAPSPSLPVGQVLAETIRNPGKEARDQSTARFLPYADGHRTVTYGKHQHCGTASFKG